MIHCSVQGLIKFSFFFYLFYRFLRQKNGKNSLSKINLFCTAGTCWIDLSVHSVCDLQLSWFLLLRGAYRMLKSFLSFPAPPLFLHSLPPPPPHSSTNLPCFKLGHQGPEKTFLQLNERFNPSFSYQTMCQAYTMRASHIYPAAMLFVSARPSSHIFYNLKLFCLDVSHTERRRS